MQDPVIAAAPIVASPQEKSKFRQLVESILWGVMIAVVIRYCVVEPFKIPSGSMENTLAIGDHLLVSKFLYGVRLPYTETRLLRIRAPQRGDVIVFKFPEDRSKDFIKRVVGLPGDVVQVRDKQLYINEHVYVNGHEVHKEPSLLAREVSPRDNYGPVTVPTGTYFVMGDNRDRSYDSRFWGFVKDSDIKGKAIIKYWSWIEGSWRVRWESIGRLIE